MDFSSMKLSKQPLTHVNSWHLQQPVARAAHKTLLPGHYKNSLPLLELLVFYLSGSSGWIS